VQILENLSFYDCEFAIRLFPSLENGSVCEHMAQSLLKVLEEVVRLGLVRWFFACGECFTVDIFIIYEIWLDNLLQESKMSIVCYSWL